MHYHIEIGNEHSMGKARKVYYVVDENGIADIECHNEELANRVVTLLNDDEEYCKYMQQGPTIVRDSLVTSGDGNA